MSPVVGTPTFTANIQPVFNRCIVCHKATNPTAGLNLTSYQGVMAGSATGSVVVSGDPSGSRLVQVQSGKHFANLSSEELDLVKRWIEAGLPE